MQTTSSVDCTEDKFKWYYLYLIRFTQDNPVLLVRLLHVYILNDLVHCATMTKSDTNLKLWGSKIR